MLVMEDKLSPQFGSICSELAEDYAVTDNAKCKGIDEHMYTMKTVDPGILEDILINSLHKGKFDNF